MPLDWLGPGLLLAAPHAFWRGLTAAYILPKMLLLGLGAAAVAAAALRRRADVPATALDAPLAALAAVSLASALASIDPALSVVGRNGGFSDGLWGLAVAVCCWFAGSWLDERRRAALPRLALWAGAVAAAHAVLQNLGLDPWKIGPLPSGRAVGGVGSPVDLGGYLALLFPLAVGAAVDRGRPAAERVLAALYLAGLAATGSRAAWVGALAAGAVFLALSKTTAPRGLRLVLALALTAAVCGTIGRRAGALRSFSASDSGRVAVWRVAWRAAAARPLLGYGPGTFEHAFRFHRRPEDVKRMLGAVQLQDHAHNGVLNALSQGGALGLAAWTWLCAALLAALWAARDSPGVPAAGAGAAAVAVILQVDPLSVEVLATAALLVGAALAGRPAPGPGSPAPGPGRPRAFAVGLLAASLLVALTAARISAADRHAQRAAKTPVPAEALAGYERALSMRPDCTAYAISYINRLGDAINAAPDAPTKAALIEKAAAAGRDIARRRPHDMKAHYALGISLLMAAQLGLTDRLPAAAAALDEARNLDPWHEPLLASRLEVAQRQGDSTAVAEIQDRLGRLR